MNARVPRPARTGARPTDVAPDRSGQFVNQGARDWPRELSFSLAGTAGLLLCATVLALWRDAPPWFSTLSEGFCLVAAALAAGGAYLIAKATPVTNALCQQQLEEVTAELEEATTQVAEQQNQLAQFEAEIAELRTQRGASAEKLHRATAEINAADTAQLEHCIAVSGKIEETAHEGANAAGVLSALDDTAHSLASTSLQMSTNISVVATAAEEISSNINTCANTTEEISSNMSNVATTVEQLSSNLRTIDTALRELSTAITGITENAHDGATVASTAAKVSDTTGETMSLLGKSADEIGKVTNVIQIIAQQTNLLALNAAIEAASAGEAGKGFAVVANEVKELAKQTTAATEDIALKIQSIQANAGRAVQAIRDITSIISRINDLQNTIAKTVEQQKNATQEISRNVSEAVAGINQISRNVHEAADGANQSSKSINEIAAGANEVAKNVAEAAAGASGLNTKIAEAAVMVTEASRYTRSASKVSRETKDAMQQMMIAVDRVCEAVRVLESVSDENA